MVRKTALFPLLVLVIPIIFAPATTSPMAQSTTIPSVFVPPANGATTAFNITYRVFNSTDNTSSSVRNLSSNPQNGTATQVGTTGYSFFANNTGTGIFEINYTNIPILNNNMACSGCSRVYLEFVFFTPTGRRIDTGGFAAASVYDGNTLLQTIENDTSTIAPRLGQARETTGCPDPSSICYDATSQIGKSLTLVFRFVWKYTSQSAHEISVQLGSVRVIAPGFANSNSHSMTLVSSTVTHAVSLNSISYNQTVWPNFDLTLYYPTGYSSITATNTTGGSPFTLGSTQFCKAADCRAFNVTTVPLTFPSAPNKGAFQLAITATSPNTIPANGVRTVVGNIVPTHWMPGETMGVNVTNNPAVSQQGTLTVTPRHSSGQTGGPSQFSTTNGGLFNVIAPKSPLGNWTITATFTSQYDYGTANTTITVEHLKLVSSSNPLLKVSGDNNLVTVTGTVNLEGYNVLAPSSSSDVGVFAVSTTTSGPYFKAYSPSSSGLYVSNTTFVNGAFTSGSPLEMFVTITNPSSTPTLGNVTIGHENSPGVLHGVNATFAMDKLDNPPLASGSRTYEVDVTFNNGQITIKVTSLKTGGQLSVTSNGRSTPVFAARQQFGLFNIKVSSTPATPGWTTGATVTENSVETQPFAYVFTNTLVSQGGRVLASNLTTTNSSGAFTVRLSSSLIFQGRHISYIALARDVNGIVLGNQDPTGATDTPLLCGQSTGTCQPSVSAPGEATPGQKLNYKLRLYNNSTDLTMIIHVSMQVYNGASLLTSQSRTVTMAPGSAQDVSFDLDAPSSLGTYTVVFSSPEYGGPLYTSTLNVLVIPSWLQVAIPALVGLAVAVGAIVFRARRSPAGTVSATGNEKTRPAAPNRPGSRNP